MANVSDAVGRMKITVDTLDKELFARVWDTIRQGMAEEAYPTFLAPIKTDDIDCKDDMCSASGRFIASGRWGYESNVRNFGNWLAGVIPDGDVGFLEQLTFRVDYDFADYEKGTESFYSAEMYSLHYAKAPLRMTGGLGITREELEITKENLIRYGIWDGESLDGDNLPTVWEDESLNGDDLPTGGTKAERKAHTHDREL